MDEDVRNIFLKSFRHPMHSIWEAAKNNELDDLDDEDVTLAKIMMEHEDEYHNEFELADILDNYEFDPENDTNPFAHLIIHSVIENQLRDKEPIEVYQFYDSMLNKRADRHDVIHMIGNIFIHFLFQTLKYQVPFDEAGYRKVLKIYKDRRP